MTSVLKDQTSCPHCGRIASGTTSIQSFFGFRKMDDGITRVQSWCKPCRNKSRVQTLEKELGVGNFQWS